uniref:Uncharacterized protein n=1 Tax=Brassica campestris TaxID=3711 RepID=M4FGX2_BRACM
MPEELAKVIDTAIGTRHRSLRGRRRGRRKKKRKKKRKRKKKKKKRKRKKKRKMPPETVTCGGREV